MNLSTLLFILMDIQTRYPDHDPTVWLEGGDILDTVGVHQIGSGGPACIHLRLNEYVNTGLEYSSNYAEVWRIGGDVALEQAIRPYPPAPGSFEQIKLPL